jgi:dCMP deaminase
MQSLPSVVLELSEVAGGKTMRIDKDNYYLNIAKAVAARSTCLRRQYGAVIVADDEIIATGYNGAPRGEANCCDVGKCYCREHSTPIDERAARHGDQYGTCVAVHAEQNAIISAPRRSMRGATLYLACLDETIDPAPCNICDRMIKNAGITRVVTRAGTF